MCYIIIKKTWITLIGVCYKLTYLELCDLHSINILLQGFLHGIKWIMFHGHLDYFPKSPLGGRPNTKLGDHGTPNAHDY